MTLHQRIKNYINDPFPLWDNELTNLLVDYKWFELSARLPLQKSYDYSIINSIIKEQKYTETTISLKDTNIKLALPAAALQSFYDEHGLYVSDIQNKKNNIVVKVESALEVIRRVPEVFSFINKIVKSMQIIDAEYLDTDTSYSHPNIPFSIFFSVCEEESIISDFRVAESVLHEAMHLMLTLIETHVELIGLNSKETFYSPWRDEPRQIRGVLHGLFVFRGLLGFYKLMENIFSTSNELGYIQLRIDQIKRDIYQLKEFASCSDLTKDGAILTANLLPSN